MIQIGSVARLWTVGWRLRLVGSIDKVPDVSGAALGCDRYSVVVVGVVVVTVIIVIVIIIIVIGCVAVVSVLVSVGVVRPIILIIIVVHKTWHVIVTVVTIVMECSRW